MTKFRPASFIAPDVPLDRNLAHNAQRFPDSDALHFFGKTLSYRQVDGVVDYVCGWLQRVGGLMPGDRVALFMQNSPQWLTSFYAVLRGGGVVVPISPMNREAELRHYLEDSGASLLIVAEDLVPLAQTAFDLIPPDKVLVIRYADLCGPDSALPAWMAAAYEVPDDLTRWSDAIVADLAPLPVVVDPDQICALPYTSGSTGKPKACMHTHRSLMHTAAGMTYWHGIVPGDVSLGAAPMYHVSGLCHGVTSPIFAGGAVAILPRWDRVAALDAIERHRVTHASLPPTAVIDMLSVPGVEQRDLSSLRRVSSGGAAMPEAIWARLRDLVGVTFLEAYGMTETAATTHLNPPEAPRAKCLGVPFFGTQSLIADQETLKPLAPGEIGEILISGPQVFQGYWNRPEATAEAFVTIDGRRYIRSGDIGYVDADGYYYMTDRAKRMINASGLKVWPTEIENVLHDHPAVKEACVIASPDPYRGETVKALIVLSDAGPELSEQALIDWCRQRMAAYKYPRIVEFVPTLPKSPAGKILWRQLQDAEMSKAS